MSNILLFDGNSTEFTGQGKGVLSAATRCEVTEEINGQYELILEYPTNGIHYEEIKLRSIIVCEPGFSGSRQAFRVYQIDKTLRGSVMVYAAHLSYDLSGYPVQPFASYNGTQEAIQMLLARSKVDCPFTIDSEINQPGTFAVDVPSSIKSWMTGKEGSLTDIFGGEWQYDNFHCYLTTGRGSDRGATIRYGKNLTRLERSDDDQEHYTAIWAYYSYVHTASHDTNSTPAVIADTTDYKIKAIDCYYAASTSGTSAPADSAFATGDEGKAVTISKDAPYLWTYKVIHYANSDDEEVSTSTTSKQMIGEYGEISAADVLWDDFGKSLVPGEHTRKSSVKEYYFVSESNTTAPDITKDKWQTSVTGQNTKKPYVWAYTCVSIDGKKENIITSSLIPTGAYTYEKVLSLDASTEDFDLGEGSEHPTVEQLDEYVRDYIETEDVSAEIINIEFDFTQLEDVKERIELGDTIRVYNDYEEVTARCIKSVWDVLRERYTAIEVGDARVTYESSLRNRTNTQIQGALESVYEKLLKDTMTEVQMNYISTSNIETYASEYGFTKAQTVADNYSDINLSNVDTDNIAKPFYDEMDIHYLNCDFANFDVAHIGEAFVGYLQANYADLTLANIETANIDQAFVNYLNTNYATVGNLSAATARIGDIEANYVSTDTLEANYITADNISATYLKTQNLDAAVANVGYLKASEAAVTYLTAENAALQYAKVDLLNVDNAFIDHGTFKTAAIVDEQVLSVSANKITLSQLDASKIRVINLSADNITTGKLTVGGLTIDVTNSRSMLNGGSIEEGTITLAGFSQEVMDRLDGLIETWSGNTVPTLFNYPASDWTTSAARQSHVGDVYYCGRQEDMAVAGIAVAGIAVAGNENIEGRSYRFVYDNTTGTYEWLIIKDNDVAKALAEIDDIKQFDVRVARFIETTDEGVTDLIARTTTLEGTAETLSGEMTLKLNKDVFNTVAHTADENLAEIISYTDLTQVWHNDDGTTTTITGMSNIVNRLKQTEDSFSSEITSLTDTVQSAQRNFIRMIDGDINEAVATKCTFTYDKKTGTYVLKRIASSSTAYTQIRSLEYWRVPTTLYGKKCVFHAEEIVPSRSAANPRLYLEVFDVSGESGAVAGIAKAGKAVVSGTRVRQVYITKSTKSVELTMPTADCTMRLIIRMDNSNNDVTNETLTVRGVKLEIGELTTDWEPAVEDMTETIEVKYSRLYQDLDGFKMEVGDTYQTISGMGKYSTTVQMNSAISQSASQINLTVNKAVSDLNGEISSAKSEIDQLADQIVLKVRSDGKLAKVALDGSADSGSVVTIEADNIDLTGAVSISNMSASDKKTIVKSVTSKTQYGIRNSNTQAPTSWTDNQNNITWSEGDYIWTRVATTYTYVDNTSSTSYSTAVCDKELTAALSTANSASNTASSAANSASEAVRVAGDAASTANNAVNYAQKRYGTCSTAAGTAAKTTTISGFAGTLVAGLTITVYFSNANTAANPTLNVNNGSAWTGAKSIWAKGAAITSFYYWAAGDTITFTYDGTHWVMADTTANANIARWCVDNDKTQINGAFLATGTVAAEAIDVKDLKAFNATVGGWTLADNRISSGSGATYIGLDSNTSNTYGIWAGNATASSAPFRVTRGGALYATGATISGAITATSLTLTGSASLPSSKVSGLATVATSGKYTDLTSTPDLTIYITKGGEIQKIGSTPAEGATGFQVSSAGLLQASNAIIYGTVYASAGRFAGQITATSGTIGASNATNKIQIGTNTTNASIYSGSKSSLNSSEEGMYLGTDGISLGKGFGYTGTTVKTGFKVTKTGIATISDLNVFNALKVYAYDAVNDASNLQLQIRQEASADNELTYYMNHIAKFTFQHSATGSTDLVNGINNMHPHTVATTPVSATEADVTYNVATRVSRCYYTVQIDINLTLKSAKSSAVRIESGLPIPLYSISRFTAVRESASIVPLRLYVDQSGDLYIIGGSANQRYYGTFTYLCAVGAA